MTTELSRDLSTPLDPRSAHFIEWAMAKCDDEEWFHEFKLECIRELQNFYAYPNDILRQMLRAQLTKGSAHYPWRIYPHDETTKEIRVEGIDILGWTIKRLHDSGGCHECAQDDSGTGD